MNEFWSDKWYMKDGYKGFFVHIYDDNNIAKVDPETKTIRINSIDREVISINKSCHACEPDLGIVWSMMVQVKR